MANGYTYITVPTQTTLSLNAASNTLNVTGSNGLTITTNAVTNTLAFSLASNSPIPDLSVSNSLTLNPAITGTLDNIVIGGTTPKAATFSGLTVTGITALSPVNATVTISPTGTGTLVVNPNTTGTIDNMNIGASTPGTGRFTSVTITGVQGTTLTSAVTRGSVAALVAAYGVALS
jgi:hypothetical protein